MGAQKGGDSRRWAFPGACLVSLRLYARYKIGRYYSEQIIVARKGKSCSDLTYGPLLQDTWRTLRQCWRPGCLGEGEELTLKLSQGNRANKRNRGPLGATSHSCEKLREALRGQMAVRGRDRTFQNSPRFENDRGRTEYSQAEDGRPVRQRLNVSFVFPLSLFKVFFVFLNYGNKETESTQGYSSAGETEIPLKKEGRKQTFTETLC